MGDIRSFEQFYKKPLECGFLCWYNARMSYITDIQNIYYKFLAYFPPNYQPIVSTILALIIIYSVVRIIAKDFIWIVALVALVPGSVPILQSIWTGLFAVIKFLFGMK